MMRLRIQFLTGRYHATPWGRHVNEGAVEWPPSPWRLLRAFLAVGFNRLGWRRVPAEAQALMDILAAHPPTYYLPPTGGGHTRHYLPDYKGGTDKVFDAFAVLGRQQNTLWIEWPGELSAPLTQLLTDLVGGLPYLGRAEAWVEAEVTSEPIPHGLQRCTPSESPPDPRSERIPLLAPLTPDGLRQWLLSYRTTHKRGPTVANTVTDALLVDTAQLRNERWSQAPGSRWLSYWTQFMELRIEDKRDPAPVADTAIWAITSATRNKELLPKLLDTLRRMEFIHGGLISKAAKGGVMASLSCLTGKEGQEPLQGHQHAYLLPLSLVDPDRSLEQRRIDHILIHAPMGFSPEAVRALGELRKTYGKDLPELYVSLVALGRKENLGDLAVLKPAQKWRSVTPFIPPRYLKKRGTNGLWGQIVSELESRRMPAPKEINLLGSRLPWNAPSPRQDDPSAAQELYLEPLSPEGPPPPMTRPWVKFRRERLDDGAPLPPQRLAYGLELVFDTPVAGPIALGYGAHFGMGFFEPAD